LDEPFVAEHGEVLGDVCLWDLESVHEIGDRDLPVPQQIDDHQPLWVCQTLANVGMKTSHLTLDGSHAHIFGGAVGKCKSGAGGAGRLRPLDPPENSSCVF
jgi:hypothetical protein